MCMRALPRKAACSLGRPQRVCFFPSACTRYAGLRPHCAVIVATEYRAEWQLYTSIWMCVRVLPGKAAFANSLLGRPQCVCFFPSACTWQVLWPAPTLRCDRGHGEGAEDAWRGAASDSWTAAQPRVHLPQRGPREEGVRQPGEARGEHTAVRSAGEGGCVARGSPVESQVY